MVNVFDTADAVTEPGLDTLMCLVRTHFPAQTPLKGVKFSSANSFPTEELRGDYMDWINIGLIQLALSGFEKKKSPGPDGLKPVVFEHLTGEYLRFLEVIYKGIIRLHFTPKQLRETTVIFIPKPGKENYRSPKAFRPISLSNYLLKGLERLVAWKMDQALVGHPLHPKQHGFQSGKSTDSAISNTVNYIESFLFKNEYAVGVFLDISSAFDSICPEHIKRSLLNHGGDRDLVEWYYRYLKHRDLQFSLHGTKFECSNGCLLYTSPSPRDS